MKTIKQLKSLIGYAQTDEVFLDYLRKLEEAGVITLREGDIDADNKTVSDDFYERLAGVYGIRLDESLRRIPDGVRDVNQDGGM